jgi:predicted site-specific integrase-resolvase
MAKTNRATIQQIVQATRRYGVSAKTVSGYLSKGVMHIVNNEIVKVVEGRKPYPKKRPYAPVTTLCLEEYTIRDLSEYFRVTIVTVRRWIRSGILKSEKKVIDGKLTNFVRKVDVISLIEKSTT